MTDNPALPLVRIHPDVYITAKEVQKIVHLSLSSIYLLTKKGLFPPRIKVGRRSMWSQDDLLAWLNERKKTNLSQ